MKNYKQYLNKNAAKERNQETCCRFCRKQR
jgi:hypothetical protein